MVDRWDPVARGMAENPDHFFQHRESCNNYYEAVPAIVEVYIEVQRFAVSTRFLRTVKNCNSLSSLRHSSQEVLMLR